MNKYLLVFAYGRGFGLEIGHREIITNDITKVLYTDYELDGEMVEDLLDGRTIEEYGDEGWSYLIDLGSVE